VPALNSAICWELFNYQTQSAGNQLDLNLIGILRDYTLKLTVIKSIFMTQIKSSTSTKYYFASYLTGLIEGDGTIVVPKTERSIKGKLNYPSIQISFHLKDLPLALIIQKQLKNGSLSRKKGVNAYTLTINNHKGLLLVISLINGNMKTPKIYAL